MIGLHTMQTQQPARVPLLPNLVSFQASPFHSQASPTKETEDRKVRLATNADKRSSLQIENTATQSFIARHSSDVPLRRVASRLLLLLLLSRRRWRYENHGRCARLLLLCS